MMAAHQNTMAAGGMLKHLINVSLTKFYIITATVIVLPWIIFTMHEVVKIPEQVLTYPGPRNDTSACFKGTAGVSLDDIPCYNEWLTKQRILQLEKYKYVSGISYDKFVVARELKLNYFQKISQNPLISTFALYINNQFELQNTAISWLKGKQTGNIAFPLEKIYPFGLESGACDIFMARGFWKDTERLITNGTCELRSSPETTLNWFSSTSTGVFKTEYERSLHYHERIYLHMIPNASISSYGVVVQGSFYIEPLACGSDYEHWKKVDMKSYEWVKEAKTIDEVFVNFQHWSKAYFHWNVEDISRLAIYVDFLKQNPNIKIMINKESIKMSMRNLKIFGFSKDRVIWGNIVGKMVYLPQGSRYSEKVSTYGLSLAVSTYRKYMYEEMQLRQAQNTIILIHRTKKRYLAQHDTVKDILTVLANQHGLHFVVFSDTNLPSFNDTIKLFNRAAMVVAPHGAGLVNTMFSQDGTVVIEVMCPQKDSFLCYPYLSRNLGHIYYGIRHDKLKHEPSCHKLWVDTYKLKTIAEFYLSVRHHSKH